MNKNIFDYLFLTVGFLIAYLPYFFYVPLPNVDPDGFKYFKYALDLKESFFVDFSLIPPLFPCFLNFTSGLSLNNVILFQVFINFSAIIFFYYCLKKYYYNYRLFILVVLFLSIFDNYSLFYNTGIFPDSLYGSLIIFLSGLMLMVLNSSTSRNLLLVSVFVFMISLTRSNGIVFLLFPFAIGFYLFMTKKISFQKGITTILLPFICFILSWSVYNYISYDRFFPGNTYRAGVVAKNILKYDTKNIQDGIILDFDQHNYSASQETFTKSNVSRTQMLFNYLYLPSDYRINFYEYSIPNRYYHWFENNELARDSLLMGSSSYENDTIRKELYREYYPKSTVDIDKKLITILEKDNFFSIKTLYNLCFKIFDNTIAGPVWLLFFIISFIAILAFLFFPKIRTEPSYFFIVLLFCIYLGNLFTVSIAHGRYVARYVSSTELIYFLIPIITGIFIYTSYKKNHDKQ